MVNAIDKAVRAQGGAVVKPHQVKAMILAARRAYIEQSKLGLVDDGVGFDAWRRATLHDVVGAAAPDSFRTVTQRDYAAVMRYFGKLAGEEEVHGAGCLVPGANYHPHTAPGTLHPAPSTPHPAPSTLHPAPCTPHPAPSTQHPAPSTKHPAPCTQHQAPKSADEQRRALWALNLVEGEVADSFGGREGAARYADALFAKIHRTDRDGATARQVWAVIFTLRNRAAKIRSKTAPGARGAADVHSPPPDGSKRFPAFSRGF